MVSIVTDKENKTGIIMKMMGLKPSVYWTVTYFIEVAKTEAYMIMIQILGYSFRFRIFTFHDWFQYTLMLFLFSNVSVMFSFFMSTFFTKTSTTLAVSFLFAVLSFQLGIVFIHLVFTLDGGRASSFGPFMVHPFWVLYRYLDGIALMLFYRDGQGVSLSLDNDMDSLFSTCFGLLTLHWFVWFVLWLYTINVFNIGDGTRKSPLLS